MRTTTKASLLAVAAIMAASMEHPQASVSRSRRSTPALQMPTFRKSNRYPQMVTSTAEEIREHNRNCNTRQVRRQDARRAA